MLPAYDEFTIRQALRRSWSLETAMQWTAENRASGQCNVTAAVIHDLFGGEVLRTQLPGVWHYYNRFGGKRVDFSDSQFTDPEPRFAAPVRYEDLVTTREAALEGIPEREYQALKTALLAALPPYDGGCACGAVRYRLTTAPMFVHCCHCTWCQRESGAAFALNALIEADRVELLKGEPDLVLTPSVNAEGQGSTGVRSAVWRFGANIPWPWATECVLSAWARWMHRRTCRRTFTSTRRRSSLGLSWAPSCRCWRNTTIGQTIGRRRAWPESKDWKTANPRRSSEGAARTKG